MIQHFIINLTPAGGAPSNVTIKRILVDSRSVEDQDLKKVNLNAHVIGNYIWFYRGAYGSFKAKLNRFDYKASSS